MTSIREINFKTLIENNYKIIVFVFFAALFIVGLGIFKDYGINWDEEMQWKNNGMVNYNYIVHDQRTILENGNEKYHGPAFEILLVLIEKTLRLTDTRAVYLMRHFITFLAFFISAIFFYLLAKLIFRSWKLALIGSLFYVLSPSIFAHAFYNSKDSVLLSFFIISMYALFRFHEKQTFATAIIYSLITAITIDTRIIGILFPLITIGLILLELILCIFNRSKSKTNYKSVLLYFTVLIPFTILFWPILWQRPLYHFLEAIEEMSHYHWNWAILYQGVDVYPKELPWHYLPVWIAISTPFLYLIFFMVGLVTVLKPLFLKPMEFFKNQSAEIVILIWTFLPIMGIILLQSIVYDAWRHVFFIYGGFLLIVLYGFRASYLFFRNKVKANKIFLLLVFISICDITYSMIKLHPYEHLYFNRLAGKDMKEIKTKYETDYYGLASLEVLENILKIDTSAQINIIAEFPPGQDNAAILLPEQRQRLNYVTAPEDADYFIVNYRWNREGYFYRREAYSAYAGNAKICTAFKIPPAEELYASVKGKTILSFSTDFDSKKLAWTNSSGIQPFCGAHSGRWGTYVDSLKEYSDGLTITDVSSIYKKKNLVLKTSFWKYEKEIGADAKFVVSIESKDKGSYFWRAIKRIYKGSNNEIGTWKQVVAAVELPEIKSKTDVIKIYLWNNSKRTIFIDDMDINLIEEAN